jgi:lysyl endopeptidase
VALAAFGSLLPAQQKLPMPKDPVAFQPDSPAPARTRVQPPSRTMKLAEPGRVRLNPLSTAESQKIGAVGGKRRIGVHRDVPHTALSSGTWTTLNDGSRVWRLSISSASASGVRVHFTGFSIGEGKLWIYGSQGDTDGPYTGQGPYGNGDFWSATVEGESAVIEYAAAPGVTGDSLPFRVQQISHQAALVNAEIEASLAAQARAARLAPGSLPSASSSSSYALDAALASIQRGTGADPAASCNADLNCYPEWASAKRSVAELQFEETQGDAPGTYVCSGSLLATRDNSLKPYLLTAGHCIHDEPAARSLQVWWAYESAGCNSGAPTDHGVLKSTPGGHLLSWGTVPQGDWSLVLLPDVPSGVVFAGWDPSDPQPGTKVVGIHHPSGSYKRIAFGHTVLSQDVVVEGDPAPASLYTDVLWDRGLVQPGSSGSPLFTGPGVVTGMLTYGPAAPAEILCQSTTFGGYGKFSNAYPHIKDYLENLPATQVNPSTSVLRFSGLNHKITGSNSQPVTLTVGTASQVSVGIRPDAPWLVVSQESGQLSASFPLQFTVSVDPKYLYEPGFYTGTVTILSGASEPQYINVTLEMKLDASDVSVTVSPSPVPQDNGIWTLQIQLTERAGSATALTGLRIEGEDYSAQIRTWFGTATLPANGRIEGTIHVRGLFAPVDKYFEFFGQDVSSGRQWYRNVTVTFLP